MNEDTHNKAMVLADEAQRLRIEGKYEAAWQKFEQAAALEEQCADEADEPRTRGILCVSAVSLWMESGRLDRAESVACRYLAEKNLPDFRRELSCMLGQITKRRHEARASLMATMANARDRGSKGDS